MKDLTLVVMAAGMGSRFGGLKQIEPVGPNGEIIADYSIYDCLRAGFNKVVFIIRKENLEYFKNNITNKFADKIQVEFAFQELDMIPSDVVLPPSRIKMLGTGHALLCAKDKIKGNFVVINGDDFYGYDPYLKVKEFFDTSKSNEQVTITYPIKEVMSDNGAVKRGISFTDNAGYLKDVVESEISCENNKIIAKPLNGDSSFIVTDNETASMNFFGFSDKFMPLLEDKFQEFIHGKITDTNEFLLPQVLKDLINESKIMVRNIPTSAKWMGITYRSDLDSFRKNINQLIKKGEYPNNLWK